MSLPRIAERSLPSRVRQVVDCYLESVDREAPGVVEGLYLVGSTALGEFRPRTSDIDFIAVSASVPDARTLAALARVHAHVRARFPRPFFDGSYVTWRELTRHPSEAGAGPYAYVGKFHGHGPRNCDPVAWHTLAAHGIACRGPCPSDISVWMDVLELKRWTLRNFDDYWRPLLRGAETRSRWRLISFTSYGAVWIVLGVCRLHYTLASGMITSKEAAGEYGLSAFSNGWHRVLNEALRIRRSDHARADAASAVAELLCDLHLASPRKDGRSLYSNPARRRADVLAFAEMVIAGLPGVERFDP